MQRLTAAIRPRWRLGCAVVLLSYMVPSAAVADLEVTGISPAMSHNYEPLDDARISGSGIVGGATVKLVRGDLEIVGTNVIYDDLPYSFQADFALTGAEVGYWDVVVTNPGGGETATLAAGYRVREGIKIKQIGGHFGGRINNVAVQGDLAYLAQGGHLAIIDISDPANPFELGYINLTLGSPDPNMYADVVDVAVQGGYAFVCVNGLPSLFTIVDVSDPTSPRVVVSGLSPGGSNPAHHDRPNRVELRGGVAYVAIGETARDYSAGPVYAVDVSDPESMDPGQPGLFHPVQNEVGKPHAMSVSGDRLYLFCDAPDQGDGWSACQLEIFDLSVDPLNPVRLGTAVVTECGGKWSRMAIDGDLAWIPQSNQSGTHPPELLVINVADPQFPFVLARHDYEALGLHGYYHAPDETQNGWPTREFRISGGRGYLVTSGTGGVSPSMQEEFVILDVSDPFAPSVLHLAGTPIGPRAGVTVVGTTVYLPDAAEGLNILDASDPANVVPLGNYPSPANMRRVNRRGDVLYVTDLYLGVTILDVSEPRSPALVSQYQCGRGETPEGTGGADGIEERDGLLYVAAHNGGVEVLDVSDPANPFLAGAFPFGWYTTSHGLDLFGALAIVGVRTPSASWFVVFDVSDLDNIVDVDSWITGPGTPVSIETMPDGVIHSATGDGLYHARWTDTGLAAGAYVQRGDLRYYGRGWSNIRVAPVADPPAECADPAVACADLEPPPRDFGGISVRDDQRVHLAGHRLWVFDASPYPGDPVLWASYIGPNDYFDVTAEEGIYAYATGPGTSVCEVISADGVSVFQIVLPGDADDDDDVDLADFAKFQQCFAGADVAPPDADCLVFDVDDDADVDLDDLAGFHTAMTGVL